MSRVSTLFLFSVVFLVPGCSQDSSPVTPAARCVIEPEVLDLGSILPPLHQRFLEPVVATGELRNVNLLGGYLEGRIELSLTTVAARPPEIRLSPEGFDPVVSIPPGGAASFAVLVQVDLDTSPGEYEGTVSFGNGCARMSFRFTVASRLEAPPEFALFWGREGEGPGAFADPRSLAADGRGRVYVVDQGADATFQFDAGGTLLRTVQTWVETSPTGEKTRAHDPMGVAVDPSDNVFITDYEPDLRRQRVTMFNPNGGFVKRWGPVRAGGSIFDRPEFLDVDGEGLVYVVDVARFAVTKFLMEDLRLGYVTLAEWNLTEDVPGHFLDVGGIGVGADGTVHVSDAYTDRVLKYAPDGTLLASWGGPGRGPGEFRDPSGIAVDGAGNVYVADRNNHRIQKLDPEGRFLTDWGTEGIRGGQFQGPTDVAVDGSGTVYVLDAGNFRIQKFVLPGK